MEDYSKYFKNPSAFIESFAIGEDKIYVKFSGTKKFQYQTYPLTKENLEMFDQRMEEQYNKVIENKEIFNGSKKIMNVAMSIIITAIMYMFSNLAISLAPTIIEPIQSLLLLLICLESIPLTITIINNVITNRKLSTYKEYIQNKQELHKAAKKEENITKNISQEQLLEQKVLVDKGLMSTEFNINLMDNMNLKELKELLTQLKIYQGLQQPVELDEEKTKKGVFTRKKVKKEQ